MNVCRIATVPFAVISHLGDQIKDTVACGHDVFVVSSMGEELATLCEQINAKYYPVHIERKIAPFRDLCTLLKLVKFFRRNKLDLIHSITPKAGFLAAIAARIAGIPIRLHTFTGQRWSEMSGFLRWIMRLSDRIIVNLNTMCYADSHSQVEYMIQNGVCQIGKIRVIAFGSISGVNLNRFDHDRWRPFKEELRSELGIPLSAKVISFIGRLTRDKGICELVEAFTRISKEIAESHLVLIGPLEQELDPLPEETLQKVGNSKNIHLLGYLKDPERYLSISDLFVIPSYREGFGSVVLEAAAMGIPAVGTTIPGLVDAIVDGETGILVPPKETEALVKAIREVLSDEEIRTRMGQSARKRVQQYFNQEYVNELVLKEYSTLYKHRLQHG